jgi:hypothetical protein
MIKISFELKLRAVRFSLTMSKAAKKKTKKPSDKSTAKPTPQEAIRFVDDDKPFDFGGLPEKDLKKNLGCGG